MKTILPVLLCDFYKISHRAMYPKGTEFVYSTWTPRMTMNPDITNVAWFGGQAFYQEFLIEIFQTEFFDRPKKEVIEEYVRVISRTLGDRNPDTKHLEDLHDLGYLPLSIKALPEGTIVPMGIPLLTIENTDPRFFWLTNFIESLASCQLWQATTSATIAFEYKKLFRRYAFFTGGTSDYFLLYQGHDFSMRGMSSLNSAILSGMGHLTSFIGTDTIPAILAAEKYYDADFTKCIVGTSIPATEHSIQSAYEDDERYLKEIITQIHPSGPVSIVSDGYDFWHFITVILPSMKSEIISRNSHPHGMDKVVIRPDSGDPVKIICGDPSATIGSPEYKGAMECLWDIFGGRENERGYKILDPHIGLIYGDSITIDRAKTILQILMNKGFASSNIVFGIGSYTYQYNTRDTFGFALKSTWCMINGVPKEIFKNPKTGSGFKKSHKGRVAVLKSHITGIHCVSGVNHTDKVEGDLLKEVFRDGKLLVREDLSTIIERINSCLYFGYYVSSTPS